MAATRPTWWSPSTSRCCSGACAPANSSPAASSCWRACGAPTATRRIAASYAATYDELVKAGYRVYEIPMEQECRKLVSDPRRGKNMFVLGMLCSLYSLDRGLAREQIGITFGKKDAEGHQDQYRSAGRRLGLGRRQSRFPVLDPGGNAPPSRSSSSTATPRWRSACSPRAWKSAPCIRSRRRPRCRIISATCSSGSAGWCTRPRTRSRPAPSRSAPPTPASARSR